MPTRTTETLRVGLIGLGSVSESHLAAYREVATIEVVAAAEPCSERLKEMARRWGVRPYGNAAEMLDAEELDICCVLTPAATHREITEFVASQGVHVLCEKPLALTLQDARAMIDACTAAGVRLAYGSSYRFLPACKRAKQLIDDGAIGEISLLMETCIGGSGPEGFHDYGPSHYPRGGPGPGGMGLIDHGIHLVDTFCWLVRSELDSVVGRGNIAGQTPASEHLTMTFANGATGHLIYNDVTFPCEMPQEGIFSWGSG